MLNTSKVILPKRFWNESSTKQELKQKISDYMRVSYPTYTVLEIHKYYAVCEINR